MLDSGLLSHFQLRRSIWNEKVSLLRPSKRDHYEKCFTRKLPDSLSRFLKLGNINNQTEVLYVSSVFVFLFYPFLQDIFIIFMIKLIYQLYITIYISIIVLLI